MNRYELSESLMQEDKPKPEGLLTAACWVAEDAKGNQVLIRLLLEKMGLSVEIVENGKLAVEKRKRRNLT